ncbi:MAG TPA: molybdopterin-binding/glycosyltransferase family 2 protein [Azospirillaceae bacterium]|nr:molybdopterin-binding/glycosyltransferase family 2 protein [Azospirillaceae bacterium]
MRFGSLPLDEALGAVLAHSLHLPGGTFRKGRVLTADDLERLRAAGHTAVAAAKLDGSDVAEDAAAARIAAALLGPGLSASAAYTGRVNLFAEAAGLLVADAARIDALNLLDEAVTAATLPSLAPVEAGQMAATVKIIPFAAPEEVVAEAERIARDGGPALRLAPYRGIRAGLLQTTLPGTKPGMLDKTVEVTSARLAAVAGELVLERRCGHTEAEVAEGLAALAAEGLDLLLVAGASAITDRRDVLPAGIGLAGGTVVHFGMPVDPGNLLLLARLGGVPVLGLPGCARSPKLNGFDWVLQRVAAGVEVTRADIMRLGVGGLLTEIPSRPLPRAEAAPRAPRIAALVLAAGLSRRMGANKLLADDGGVPLVRRTVEAVLASRARPVTVVTGHQSEAVRAALAGLPVSFVHAADHAEGLSASLKAGLRALPAEAEGVLVCLGDMPRVPPAVLDRLAAAWNPLEGRAICVPTFQGRRGNPVLWDRRLVPEMLELTGDQGARGLMARHADQLCEVAVETDGVLLDVDTPEALAALRT